MQVKLLDYGVPSEMQPKRAHANDVGADVYALKDRTMTQRMSIASPSTMSATTAASFIALCRSTQRSLRPVF